MTVQELINLLNNFPKDLEVVVTDDVDSSDKEVDYLFVNDDGKVSIG